MTRRLFVVSRQDFGPIVLGTAARQLEIARGGVLAGAETFVVGESCTRELPDGVSFLPLSEFDPLATRPGDALVVNAYMGGRWLLRLLRSRVPFHTDLYCVTATEILPSLDSLSGRKAWHQRWRRVLRYAALCARAETVYVSNTHQTALLGGMMFSLPGRAAQNQAFALPSKTVVAPMSPPRATFPTGSPSPFPPVLAGRPVFLWGGGIWKWFDVETALEAFSILRDRGSPAALFFLAGRNPSNLAEQDEPHRRALESARSRGLLGSDVFFNERSVGPSELPAYLEHCHAGILANGAHLESLASWRTRQLDLLWAGRPAVVAGEDPLSRRMADSGAGWIVRTGDAAALADALEASLDPHIHRIASEASRALALRMVENGVDRIVESSLRDEAGFEDPGRPVDRCWFLRYVLGF